MGLSFFAPQRALGSPSLLQCQCLLPLVAGSAHQLADTWAVCNVWLSPKKLLWTFMCRLYVNIRYFSGINAQVQLLGCIFRFYKKLAGFSRASEPFVFPRRCVSGCLSAASPALSYLAFLTSVRWHLIVVLIPNARDVECLFACSFTPGAPPVVRSSLLPIF